VYVVVNEASVCQVVGRGIVFDQGCKAMDDTWPTWHKP